MMNLKKFNFVLFGSTGDLARLKILPALLELAGQSEDYQVHTFCVGRQQMDTAQYMDYLVKAETHPLAQDLTPLNLEYLTLDFDKPGGFDLLWQKLPSDAPTLLFMAIAPDVLATCVARFQESKTQIANHQVLITVEKPFGDDLTSAQELNTQLTEIFGESNVYRHDHYLSKDSVQALVTIRQTDPEIAALLTKENLNEVQMVASETLDVGNRARYFDGRGMLVDWVQSHCLQVLATLCAPLNSDFAQSKTEFIGSLNLIPDSIIRARYDGYQQVEGVNPSRQTETFFAAQLKSKLPEWQGVVFSVITGKAMAEKKVLLRLKFKNEHPKLGFHLDLALDPPGGHPLLETLSGDEYTEIIVNALAHNRNVFVTQAEVEAQWQVTDEIKAALPESPLQTYAKGTSYAEFCNDKWCTVNYLPAHE